MTDAERIHAYLDDTLSAADVRQLWYDLDRDPALQTLLAEQVALHRRIVGDVTAIEPPAWIRSAVLASVALRPSPAGWAPSVAGLWLRRLAAMLVVAATLVTSMPMTLERTPPASAPQVTTAISPAVATAAPTIPPAVGPARPTTRPIAHHPVPAAPYAESRGVVALVAPTVPPSTLPLATIALATGRVPSSIGVTVDATTAIVAPIAVDLRGGTGGLRTVALHVPIDADGAFHVGVAVDERPWTLRERRMVDGRPTERAERRSVLAVLGECSFDLERTSLTVPVALRLALGANDRGPQAGIGVHYTVVTVGAFRLSAGIDAAVAAAPTTGWAVSTSIQPVIGLQVTP